jgi:hypothetical protein
MADANYACSSVLEAAHQRAINFLCPPTGRGRSKKSNKSSIYGKHEFIHDEATNTYQCPAGQTMHPTFGGYEKSRGEPYVGYSTSSCKTCPLIAQCTTSLRGRRLKRYPSDDLVDAMRTVWRLCSARQKAINIFI